MFPKICSRIPGSPRNFSLSLSPSPPPSLSLSVVLFLSLYRSLSLSLSFSFSLYICLSISLSFVRPSVHPSVHLYIRPSFFLSFSRLEFLFLNKSSSFYSSRNSRRERELFLVPENKWRDMFGNCFHENFGNWRDMTGKL